MSPISYRPFDKRFIVYDPSVVTRPRTEVMRHMLAGKNLALISARSNKSPSPDHFFCSKAIVETKCGESTTQSYTFPLYLYPSEQEVASGLYRAGERRPNLNPDFIVTVAQRLGLHFIEDGHGDLANTFGPEDVFCYAYAIFHSPTYRNRYAQFLKTDFPRLPLTSEMKLFSALVDKGKELVALHLLESNLLANPAVGYPVAGSNQVDSVRYSEAEQRVYVNKEQYFTNTTPEVWAFQVGGYQVCQKWLKDRKGRTLTLDELEHYQRIVITLKETIRLMAEIDAIIPAWPLP